MKAILRVKSLSAQLGIHSTILKQDGSEQLTTWNLCYLSSIHDTAAVFRPWSFKKQKATFSRSRGTQKFVSLLSKSSNGPSSNSRFGCQFPTSLSYVAPV
jgi:hypothetical protein